MYRYANVGTCLTEANGMFRGHINSFSSIACAGNDKNGSGNCVEYKLKLQEASQNQLLAKAGDNSIAR